MLNNLTIYQKTYLTNLFKNLANSKRLEILNYLSQQEDIVSNIAISLGIKSVTVSDYLNNMRRAGLVKARQEGTYMYYSIKDNVVRSILPLALEFCRIPR